MKMRILKIAAVVAMGLVANQVLAADLVDVYQQALTSDPLFQQQRAQWLSDRENIAIAQSAFLPALDLTAELSRARTHTNLNRTFYANAQQYGVTLSQQIFNYENWAKLQNASAFAKSSAATFNADAQNLISRVAKAYFDILEAQDILRFTLAEKRALARQLEQDRQRYKVGLIAITGVYQTQAQYDAIVATEIRDRNDLANKKEILREITGEQYKYFAKLGSYLPLLKPDPANINKWVKAAIKQNYTLLSARYALVAAKENIKQQSAQRFPTVNAVGSAEYSKSKNKGGTPAPLSTWGNSASIGLNLDFPAFQGGLFSAQTRQAEYDFQKATAFLEETNRGTISQTRQDYLGVLSNIGAIKADKRTIISDHASLKATEAEYIVGTSTMLDVLNAQSKLYEDQKILATDQYSYIEQTLALKEDAGILSMTDLAKINNWLYHNKHMVKTKIKTKPKPKAKISKHVIPSIKKQLLSINPNHYTIQLMASRNRKTIINFINTHKIAGKIYIYKGKNLYKLIAGEYPNSASAHQALKRLPTNIKAWVKSFAAVHQELKS